MSSRAPRLRLERLAAELRAQPPPQPREPGLPPRLRAEFRRAAAGSSLVRSPSRSASARLWLPALGLGLAAAALVLVLVRPGGWAPGGVHGSAPPIATLDGQQLDVGVLVVAAAQPRHVEHAGRASWELSPGSRARLLSTSGGVLRVSLEQGSLAAEVQPSAQQASFVVQARGTEVLVHGTRFVVSSSGERVHVAVLRGQVEVRPVASAAAALPATGTLLGPGMQGDFWAGATEPPAAIPSHASSTSMLPAVAALPAAPVAPHPVRSAHPGAPSSPATAKPDAPPASTPAAPAPEPSAAGGAARSAPAAPAAPSAAAASPEQAQTPAAPAASVEQALETVTQHVQNCFRQQLPGSSELGIEATTRLGLWVEPDGELLRADFDPPLAPSVESCVAAQLAHLRVARSPAGFRVERDLRLRR